MALQRNLQYLFSVLLLVVLCTMHQSSSSATDAMKVGCCAQIQCLPESSEFSFSTGKTAYALLVQTASTMGHPSAVSYYLEGAMGEILTAVWFLETQKQNRKRTLACIKLRCFSAKGKSKESFHAPHGFPPGQLPGHIG